MTTRALVYGDVDPSSTDGCAVWPQAITRALAAAGCTVSLVLKTPVRTDQLTAPLENLAEVTLRRPHQEGLATNTDEGGLSPEQAVPVLAQIDAEQPVDLVVLRGRRLAALAAQSSQLRGRLWTYLAEVPQHVADLTPAVTSELTDIAAASHLLLCQTEDLRCFVESVVPAACGKSVVFGPIVDVAGAGLRARPSRQPGEPLRLVYTGTFAPRWNTRELTELPAALQQRGIPTELHMLGEMTHRDSAGWSRRMRTALEETPSVLWHGGRSRAETHRTVAGCDVGLSWRVADLEASLDLSTTMLEMGALGLPVVLNRTRTHEDLLGEDYPLFVESDEPDAQAVADVLASAVGSAVDPAVDPASADAGTDTDALHLAARRCGTAADSFTLDQATARLRDWLAELKPAAPAELRGGAGRPLRVAIAGPDLTLFTQLGEYLAALPGIEVRFDEWQGVRSHDTYRSTELAAWADVVICEWCGPNALFYAARKRSGQRLIVRLHHFELDAQWPYQIDIDQVDAVVCVSAHYAQRAREHTGWPAEKVVVIAHWVDTRQLDRPKLPGTEHVLGMLGATPSRKRLDRALDVLAELRALDDRYTLAIKTRQPWDYWWVWNRPEERDYYERTYRRIQRSQTLAASVVFDPGGPDVAAWLRRVGFVLSTSDDESFHLPPAECAASGGVPAVLAWPGAETIYSPQWVHADPTEMAHSIHAIVAGGHFDKARRAAQQEITGAYALEHIRAVWTKLIL